MIQDYDENEFPSCENFECSECHKMFKYESHFSRHILTHSDQRPYACSSCGKKFKRQDALKTHERTHSDDLPFKCSQAECFERFASKAALRYHELRHANQSEFLCDIDGCNKKFLTLGQLKQHQRTKIHSKKVQILNGEMRIQESQLESVQRQSQSQSQLSSNPPQQSNSVNLQFPAERKNSSQLSASSSGLLSVAAGTASSLVNLSGKKRSFEELKQHSISQIKKEQNQADGFLDYFSEDEQAFIDQIWSTIKQENQTSNNADAENVLSSNQVQLNQELQEQSQYLTSKRRHLSSFGKASASQQCSSSHSDLLLEFSRISSSGNSSSFGRLKQELRIIVGLIDKIKKEDQDIFVQDPDEINQGTDIIQRETIKREMVHERNQEDNCFQNQSYHENQQGQSNHCFDSQEANARENEEIDAGFPESPKQNFQFYQHDESPFHDYDCQFLHKSIPSEIVKSIHQEEDQDKTMDSSKILNRPLLKRKIKTAVRLVQYCKKVFLDERKQAIQHEQQHRRQQELQQQQKREQQEKLQQQQSQIHQEMNFQKLFAASQFQMKQPGLMMPAAWNSGAQVLAQENMNFAENSNSQFFVGDDQSVFFQECFNPLNSQILNNCQLGRQNSLNLSMNPIIQRGSSQVSQGANSQIIHQIVPTNQQQFIAVQNMNSFNNHNHAIQQQPQLSYASIIPSMNGISSISSSIPSSIPSSKPLSNLSHSCHPSPCQSENSLRLCMSSEVEGGSQINREPMQFGNIFDAADEIGSINQDYAFLEELASFNACMQAADPTRNI